VSRQILIGFVIVIGAAVASALTTSYVLRTYSQPVAPSHDHIMSVPAAQSALPSPNPTNTAEIQSQTSRDADVLALLAEIATEPSTCDILVNSSARAWQCDHDQMEGTVNFPLKSITERGRFIILERK
jgi:hypothetical protein